MSMAVGGMIHIPHRKYILAVCCSVLQRVAVCCSVLQCVAVCCSAEYVYTYMYVYKYTYIYVLY